jgi:hypothetical protein
MKIAKIMGLLLLAIFLVTAGMILYGIFSAAQYPWDKIGQASAMIATRSGISIYFVKGIVILVSIYYFYAWSKLLPNTFEAVMGFSGPATDPLFLFRNKWGWIIVGYLGCFYLVLGSASRTAYAYKYCADTPGGLFMTDNTGVDPKYGMPLIKCTQEQIEEVDHPDAPRELSAAAVKQRGFFNISGYPQIWYVKDEHGAYRFFDRRGVDREGDQLSPVTRAVVADWRRQQQQQHEARTHAQERETLVAQVARAQQQYQSGNLEDALQSCQLVLKANPADESCSQVQQDASAKLAHQLVSRAQAELQRGELVDAARDANRASKLDPKNTDAKTVQKLAEGLNPSGSQ